MATVFNVTLFAILATIVAGTKGFVVNQLGQLGGGSDCTPAHASTTHSASQANDLTWVTTDMLGSQISCTVLPADNAALQITNVYTQVITNIATITVNTKGVNDHECAKVDSDAGKPGLFQQIANNVTVQKLANSATQASVSVNAVVHTVYDTEWQCTDNPAGQTKTLKVAQELTTTLSNTTSAKCTDNQVVCFNSADNDASISCLDKTTYCGASYECIPATAGGPFKEANLRAVCGGSPPATTTMPPSTTANSGVFTTSAAGITVMSTLVLLMVKLF